MKVESARVEFSFTCLCGKKADVIRDEKGEPAITHEIPTCATFDRSTAPDYLERVRTKRAIQ